MLKRHHAKPRGALRAVTREGLLNASDDRRSRYLDINRVAVEPQVRPGRHIVGNHLLAANNRQMRRATVDRVAAQGGTHCGARNLQHGRVTGIGVDVRQGIAAGIGFEWHSRWQVATAQTHIL